MQREPAALLDQHGNLARRIVEIAEVAGDGRAIGDAGGRLARAHAIATEIAFHHHPLRMASRARLFVRRHALRKIVLWLVVEVSVGIGTGHHAGAAADAQIVVDVDDAVLLPLEACAGRAGVDAGRVFAMIAQHRQRELADRRVLALLLLEDARVVDARRRAVLRLASELAAVAADAALEVDHYSPSHDACSTGVTRTLTHKSRLMLTGLACSQSSSSRSL